MEDQQQSFAVFVFEVLLNRHTELAKQWSERAQLASVGVDETTRVDTSKLKDSSDDKDSGRLMQALLASMTHDAPAYAPMARIGLAIGGQAHRHGMSLHLMLRELDLLSTLLLRAAEQVAGEKKTNGTPRDGLVTARRIIDVISQLRLTATLGYTQALSDELRERYRAIRHHLRNPLSTIRNAVALLTDETVPSGMRDSRQVRAMVVRNTRSLDQLIGEVLGDGAAQLRAFDAPGESSAISPTDTSAHGAATNISPKAI